MKPHKSMKQLVSGLKEQAGDLTSLVNFLPKMFRLKGKPVLLDNFFPFEPFFQVSAPPTILFKTARQVSKTTNLALETLLWSLIIPHFSTLHVTPFFEMTRRFSNSYVKEFVDHSPFKKLLVKPSIPQNVLQRTFSNNSTIYFSFAFLSADRTRGISADKNTIDEVQDMPFSNLEIIHETLSASPLGIKRYTGTPKSTDNTIHYLWTISSQAEWVIPCRNPGCGHWNVPNLEHDLLAMIGPIRDDIGPERPGVVCAKCRKPINPRLGHWYHFFADRKKTFSGYHVPQIIMPMHYEHPHKWAILVNKYQGRTNTSRTGFLNEVCGESCDSGHKLLTATDLKNAACLPWKNSWKEAVEQIGRYETRVLAVDWGGGGGLIDSAQDAAKHRTSFTTLALLGYRPDGSIEIVWGHRSTKTNFWEAEAALVLECLRKFRCKFLIHDYTGAGAGREVLITQGGFPPDRIVGVKYVGAARRGLMVRHPPTEDHPREWYSLDKSRALSLVCLALKSRKLKSFQYDYVSPDEPGLLHDFLSLYEEKTSSLKVENMYYIASVPGQPDDFAQAVTIGACALWYAFESWPDFSNVVGPSSSADMPSVNWEEIN